MLKPVVQASAWRVTLHYYWLRPKVRRSKTAKGAVACWMLGNTKSEGNWDLQSSEALRGTLRFPSLNKGRYRKCYIESQKRGSSDENLI